MATRRAIRESFYDVLYAAASGNHTVTYDDTSTETITVSDEDITYINPEAASGEKSIDTPRVAYDERYRRVRYNGAGAGPTVTVRNTDGSVDREIWREYVEGQFTVQIFADNIVLKEPIYEAIRTTFQQYSFGGWYESNINSDIIDVEVRGADPFSMTDREDVVRGDRVEIYITFYRDYEFSTSVINTIEHNVEGFVYTTE